MKNAPRVAFLGIAERASMRIEHSIPAHYLFGLKSVMYPFIYPVNVSGWQFVVAVYDILTNPLARIKFNDGDKDLGFIEIRAQLIEVNKEKSQITEHPQTMVATKGVAYIPANQQPEWTIMVARTQEANFALVRPGTYNLILEDQGKEVHIGSFICDICELPPFTEDRKAALRSDPSVAKMARTILTCNKCSDSLKSYVGLEKSAELEAEDYIWFENLPINFKCKCETNEINLEYMRKNMHGLLQSKHNSEFETVSVTPLYESSAVHTIYQNFAALLDKKLPEEAYQQFIQENPLLLHSFSPERLFNKATVLSLRKTDFIILTPQRELVLIEIEKPATKLLKADGGTHSQLQHAFDQVREWLHTFSEHRLAALECVDLKKEDVASIKGVVIAGRDSPYNPEHLRRLKGVDHGNIKFFTYDDILGGFSTLIQAVKKL
jgi:hypothetical protein